MDVLGVGWDGREGDPPRRAAGGGDGKPRRRRSSGPGRRRAGRGASLRQEDAISGVIWVEEDRKWGLRCAARAAAMADGGELDSGELEAGAAVGELLRHEAKLVGWIALA